MKKDKNYNKRRQTWRNASLKEISHGYWDGKGKALYFGCGVYRANDAINCDIQVAKGIQKSFNFEKFPYPFKDNEFDFIYSNSVFEHLTNDKLPQIVNELHRITKKGGIIVTRVPYAKSLQAFDDPMHKTFFTERGLKHLFLGNPTYHNEIEENSKLIKFDFNSGFYGKMFKKIC